MRFKYNFTVYPVYNGNIYFTETILNHKCTAKVTVNYKYSLVAVIVLIFIDNRIIPVWLNHKIVIFMLRDSALTFIV